MSDALLLALRFRPVHSSASCYDVAEVFEELEDLYVAVLRATQEGGSVQRHLTRQHRTRMGSVLGEPGALLSEIEYRSRALRRLESEGAPEDALERLRQSIQLLAESDTENVYFGRRSRSLTRSELITGQLDIRRISMGSPLELITAIPFEYWSSTAALVTLLAAIERRFNMVGRIKTERATLAAERAQSHAAEREAEVREREASTTLRLLQAHDEQGGSAIDEHLLDGLAAGQAKFDLESGSLDIDGEDPASTD